MAELERILATAQAYLDENRPDVRAAVENARSITERGDDFLARVEGELADEAAALLADGRAALDAGRDALERADELLAEQTPNLTRSLANFRLASDQLRETLLEVRRSPWRLLYRPDTRELEYELLYDAARSYAGAVSDLRAAGESLRALSAGGEDADAARDGTVEALTRRLEGAFERYEEAEALFLEALIRGAGGAGGSE